MMPSMQQVLESCLPPPSNTATACHTLVVLALRITPASFCNVNQPSCRLFRHQYTLSQPPLSCHKLSIQGTLREGCRLE